MSFQRRLGQGMWDVVFLQYSGRYNPSKQKHNLSILDACFKLLEPYMYDRWCTAVCVCVPTIYAHRRFSSTPNDLPLPKSRPEALKPSNHLAPSSIYFAHKKYLSIFARLSRCKCIGALTAKCKSSVCVVTVCRGLEICPFNQSHR